VTPQPHRLLAAKTVLIAGLLAGGIAGFAEHARAQDLGKVERELSGIESDAQLLRQTPLSHSQLRSPTHVEERLTDGELFFRLQDYVRASVILSDIVDNYQTHPSYPDALFLLAESLFKAGDYFGARTRYRTIIQHADQPAYRPHVSRSLGRLIEIAIHVRDFEGVDEYFTRLSRLPPSEVESATNYFRAKYLYSFAIRAGENANGEVDATKIDAAGLDQARLAFEAVAQRSPYYPQARYFIGVIYMLRGQMPAAIEAFRRVAVLPATTEDERRIVDLAKLGIGRLCYELDQLDRAIEAYQSVARSSSAFDDALYELAWVYIRMGDASRAEQALEVMSVAAPESQHIPDGKLLRANLLLRNGQYDSATVVFDEVGKQFGPVREELDRMLAAHDDAVAYFQQLVRNNIEVFDAAAFLPPSAQRWAIAEGDMDRAMDTLRDMSQARQLVRETTDIVQRLDAALSAPNLVAVFRDLRQQRERSVVLRNRLARVHKDLIAIDAKATAGYNSAELAQVRARRRDLERSVAGAPVDDDALTKRSFAESTRFTNLSKSLSSLDVELMGMEARIVATERFLAATGRTTEQPENAAVYNELSTQRAAVAAYRERMRDLTVRIETGRLQVGVGDPDFAREEAVRKEYDQLVDQERQILRSLGARIDPRVDAAFNRSASVEDTLDQRDQQIDAIVTERATEMRKVIGEEKIKLDGYRARLGELQLESEQVVGGVALLNFRAVRQRFYDLVLRADVGVIDVAWAVREMHRTNAEQLTRERVRAIQALEDEFRDILDQAGNE
jgi:tetratricopeptide (TPR) repeat protein